MSVHDGGEGVEQLVRVGAAGTFVLPDLNADESAGGVRSGALVQVLQPQAFRDGLIGADDPRLEHVAVEVEAPGARRRLRWLGHRGLGPGATAPPSRRAPARLPRHRVAGADQHCAVGCEPSAGYSVPPAQKSGQGHPAQVTGLGVRGVRAAGARLPRRRVRRRPVIGWPGSPGRSGRRRQHRR